MCSVRTRPKPPHLKVIDAGSYDYFIKPIDTDVLRHLLERAVEKLHIQRENRILRQEISRKSTHGDLIGSTDAMSHVFDSIKRMARATTNVIIRGESGVGKELVARALHEQSPRRNRAFVSVNCAALPEGLMEAELFGYEKGRLYGRGGRERRHGLKRPIKARFSLMKLQRLRLRSKVSSCVS